MVKRSIGRGRWGGPISGKVPGALCEWLPGQPVPPEMKLAELVKLIAEVRHIVDRNLQHPARWRGWLRRELRGDGSYDEQQRYAAAYDHARDLADMKKPPAVNARLLCNFHGMLTGIASFRDGPVRVGPHGDFPDAAAIPELVSQAFAKAERFGSDAAVAAATLHLDLLAIHPFSDGNGRVARLLASYVLMRGGYRSTLLTAVEQQLPINPVRHNAQLQAWHSEAQRSEAGIVDLLRAMIANAWHVAWFRASADIEKIAWESLRGKLDLAGVTALRDQLVRLRNEEDEDDLWGALHAR